jgi:subtilisin family serine protease
VVLSAKGIGSLIGANPGDFYYVGGTSMATPHVVAVAALMLQKDSSLIQDQVESIMKATALPVPNSGTRSIFNGSAQQTITWDTDCGGTPCDPVGAGLLQADTALNAVP